jgi:hypothetical protein
VGISIGGGHVDGEGPARGGPLAGLRRQGGLRATAIRGQPAGRGLAQEGVAGKGRVGLAAERWAGAAVMGAHNAAARGATRG